MTYTLTRTNRKTCAIYVRDGAVEVHAPHGLPLSEIEGFLAVKSDWIQEKLALSTALLEQRTSFSLTYGDTVRYRGNLYPILARPGKEMGFSQDGFFMPLDLTPEELKSACIQIYRYAAKSVLPQKVQHFAPQMGVSPNSVKITGAKTRWGSCSARGNLCFSWQVMMAGEAEIDYIVVHELAHLKELNHGPRFWALVEAALPAYETCRERLKALQDQLRLENWS